ncbi:MAG: hypothetical protein EBZ58_09630 [Bacteroidetes bacterium]|jgi:hypothetical protein|nr:hypothetical protein [Bacteroidota bacterium]
MLKDIIEPDFDGVGIAVVRETNELNEWIWNVYLINFNNETLTGVLVSSKGYGTIDGEKRESSTLRHFLDTIEPLSYLKIEPIIEDVFVLNNEYWLSFYLNGKIYDRKFVFMENTIVKDRLQPINIIDKNGMLLM